MSDYNRLDPVALDNYITGHYGEDQFRDEEAAETQRVAAMAALERVVTDLESAYVLLVPVAHADPCYEPLLRAQDSADLGHVLNCLEEAQRDVERVLGRLRAERP